MRWAALSAGAAAVVLAVGLALGWWQGGRSNALPDRPLTATTSLSPRSLSFGDPLTARIDLLVDPRKADPASVRVRPRFSPYRAVSTTLRRRTAGGVLLSYRYALECLSPACLPGRTLAERRFLPALVSYTTPASRLERQTVEWPDYRVVSRLTSPDIGDPTERLRADAPLPAVTYRIPPGTLQALLAAASAALVLAALTLVALALPPRRGRPAGLDLPPLEQALLLVRASSVNGYPAERRKALGRLARALRACGQDGLAQDAVRLAWSAEPPSPEAATTFAERVEASL